MEAHHVLPGSWRRVEEAEQQTEAEIETETTCDWQEANAARPGEKEALIQTEWDWNRDVLHRGLADRKKRHSGRILFSPPPRCSLHTRHFSAPL